MPHSQAATRVDEPLLVEDEPEEEKEPEEVRMLRRACISRVSSDLVALAMQSSPREKICVPA